MAQTLNEQPQAKQAFLDNLWLTLVSNCVDRNQSGSASVRTLGAQTILGLTSKWKSVQWLLQNTDTKNSPLNIDFLSMLLYAQPSAMPLVNMTIIAQLFMSAIPGSYIGQIYRDNSQITMSEMVTQAGTEDARQPYQYAYSVVLPVNLCEYLKLFLYIYQAYKGNTTDVVPNWSQRKLSADDLMLNNDYVSRVQYLLVYIATLNPTFWAVLKSEYIKFIRNGGAELLDCLYVAREPKDLAARLPEGMLLFYPKRFGMGRQMNECYSIESMQRFKEKLELMISTAKAILSKTKIPIQEYIEDILNLRARKDDLRMTPVLNMLDNLLKKSVVLTNEGEVLKVTLISPNGDNEISTLNITPLEPGVPVAGSKTPTITKLALVTPAGDIKDIICLQDEDIIAMARNAALRTNSLQQEITQRVISAAEIVKQVRDAQGQVDDFLDEEDVATILDEEARRRLAEAENEDEDEDEEEDEYDDEDEDEDEDEVGNEVTNERVTTPATPPELRQENGVWLRREVVTIQGVQVSNWVPASHDDIAEMMIRNAEQTARDAQTPDPTAGVEPADGVGPIYLHIEGDGIAEAAGPGGIAEAAGAGAAGAAPEVVRTIATDDIVVVDGVRMRRVNIQLPGGGTIASYEPLGEVEQTGQDAPTPTDPGITFIPAENTAMDYDIDMDDDDDDEDDDDTDEEFF